MFITIPPWDVLVTAFKLDIDGDITNDDETSFIWGTIPEAALPSDRQLEIADVPDSDGDRDVIDSEGRCIHWIMKEFYDFCIAYTALTYGSIKHLRGPYEQTDRRDR